MSALRFEVSNALQPVVISFSQVCARVENNSTQVHPNFQGMLMYATVYNIATNPQYMTDDEGSLKVCELLYNHYQDILSTYANQLAAKCATKTTNANQTPNQSYTSLSLENGTDGYCSDLSRVRAWTHFQIASKWMQITFAYLSRYFLSGEHIDFSKYPSLRECSHAVFFNCVLKMHVTETRDAVFALLSAARGIGCTSEAVSGAQVDFALCKRSVEMFACMNISSQPNFFAEHFFTPYLELTNKTYLAWARQRVHSSYPVDYVMAAAEMILSEKAMCKSLFSLGGSRDYYYSRIMEEIHKVILETDVVLQTLFPFYYHRVVLGATSGSYEKQASTTPFVILNGITNTVPLSMSNSLMSSSGTTSSSTDRNSTIKHEPHGGFSSMLESRNYTALSQIFTLYNTNQKRLEPLAVTIAEQVYEEGIVILGHTNTTASTDVHLDVKATVTSMSNLYYAYENILKECMDNHVVLVKAVREGMQRVVAGGCRVRSRTNDSSASYKVGFIPMGELLAKYADMTIRQHDKIADGDEIEANLNFVVMLLLLDQNKDHFQKHTKELLAGRLLSPNASSMEGYELSLLKNLRSKLGQQYTSLMDTMIKDKATISADVNRQFIEYLADTKGSYSFKFVMSVSTLRVGVWPVSSIVKDGGCLLPPTDEVREALITYEQFYHNVYKKRSLQWAHHLSTAVLTVYFDLTRSSNTTGVTSKDFTMTAHQAAILLVWEQEQETSSTNVPPLKPINIMSQAVLQRLGISAGEVKRALDGLLRIKLIGIKKDKQVADGRVADGSSAEDAANSAPFFIALNEKFTSPSRKIVVHNNHSVKGGNLTSIALGNGVSAQISLSAVEERVRDIAQDRRPAIQAVIVRIMKSRGELVHQELMRSCMLQLSSLFVVDGKVVKECIEALLDRAIMERNPSIPNVYRYVA